jgi:hypothetical protein
MIKALAVTLLGMADLVSLPKEAGLIEPSRYDTTPIPYLDEIVEESKPKKRRTPRKKHVCQWSNTEVWGVFLLGILLGTFVSYAIF